MDSNDDRLTPEEMTPTGGTWQGLLFENKHVGLPLSLVWTFTFGFAEVIRDYGSIEPNLCIDWVQLPGAQWTEMKGRSATSAFGEPIESSIYFYRHHRFETARVTALEQAGARLLVAAQLSGDVDGLGLDAPIAEAWLDFTGIYVQPDPKADSIERARDLLATFIDPSGLTGVAESHNFLFRPNRVEDQ